MCVGSGPLKAVQHLKNTKAHGVSVDFRTYLLSHILETRNPIVPLKGTLLVPLKEPLVRTISMTEAIRFINKSRDELQGLGFRLPIPILAARS